MSSGDVGMVVIGGGQAGGRAALSLRESGWDGAIDLICAEYVSPYERPVLSKEYLSGDVSHDTFQVGGLDAFKHQNVQLHIGILASHIDIANRKVMLSNGKELSYKKLLVATGRTPRIYSVPNILDYDVFYVRNVEDADRLKRTLSLRKRIAIVGAGYIGLEVAATAVKMGCTVDVIQLGERILARGVSYPVADFVLARHVTEGVRFHFDKTIEAATPVNEGYEIRLSDGQTFIIDAVLAGIGAIPDYGLATASGLKTDGGIVVDEYLCTSDPHVFAAGDVMMMHDSRTGQVKECQNWECSELQGALAARNMLGANEPYDALGWMWSDQFDMSIQSLGEIDPQYLAVDRLLERGVMTFFLNEHNQLVGVSAVGDKRIGRSISICRRLIDGKRALSPKLLADDSVDLKKILKMVGAPSGA